MKCNMWMSDKHLKSCLVTCTTKNMQNKASTAHLLEWLNWTILRVQKVERLQSIKNPYNLLERKQYKMKINQVPTLENHLSVSSEIQSIFI